MAKRVSGSNAIYHYLQQIVIPRDDAFSRLLIERLVMDLSVWFPVSVYREMPILLPYCVRDADIGKREWGTASAQGYLRDNNNMVKGLVMNYEIHSPQLSAYHNALRGRGFVASHIWRWIHIDGARTLTARHPKTYSFIPNLTWLPAQIAKLTDHSGSFAQQVLQTISHRLYNDSARDHQAS